MTPFLSNGQKALLGERVNAAVKPFHYQTSTRRTIAQIQAAADQIFFAAEARGEITTEQRESNRVVFAAGELDASSINGRIVEPGETRWVVEPTVMLGYPASEVIGDILARPWEDDPQELARHESISIEEVERRGLKWSRR